jgi:hypothetical protein
MDGTLNLTKSLWGGLKKSHVISQIYMKMLSKHVKVEDMAQFDICYIIFFKIRALL